MFKFVADNVGGAGTKRKLSPRSCEGCRRRHKRCYHTHQSEELSPRTRTGSASPELAGDAPKENDATGTDARKTSASQRPPPLPPPPPPSGLGLGSRSGASDARVRFVANLSPESAFIINNHLPAGPNSISRHGVGLWLGQDRQVAQEAEAEATSTATATSSNDQRALTASTQVLDGRSGQTLLLSVLRPALRRECLATIPPEFQLGQLSDLFFAKIDPIFPLLQEEPWEDLGEMETLAIKQCICLVAALDPSMRPHLRLPHTDEVLSQVEFRARIAAAVKQSLDLGFVTNKIVLLQVCALMAMYVDDEGFGELSAYYCAQAILHEQTLGFHVGWPDGKAGGERSRRIFWCVYVLDRLNAATNGRPTVMHRRDADQKVMDTIDNQQAPFKLLILIAQLLDYTISLYRPHAQAEEAQASAQARRTANFEDLVEMAGAQNLSSGLLASLELFYLSAVILQDRSSENQSSSEHQGFCAARIVAVASDEDKSSLVYWPVLPYSVTVAASVAYRSIRKSPMPYNRRRAFVLFRDSIQVLDDLSQAFLSARAMARLAKDTMQEVGRATERTRRESLRPPESREDSREDSAEEARAEKSSQEPGDTSHQQQQQQQQSIYSMPGLRSSQQPDAAGVGNATFAAAAAAAPYDQSQQPFFGGYDGNAEIFGNFDPNFDLGRTDAIFTASLDLSVPFFAEDWPSLGNNAMGM